MNALQVADRLHSLVSADGGKLFLSQNMVPALLVLLSNDNKQVTLSALQTLQILSSNNNIEQRQALMKEEALQPSLNLLLSSNDSEIRSLVSNIQKLLSEPVDRLSRIRVKDGSAHASPRKEPLQPVNEYSQTRQSKESNEARSIFSTSASRSRKARSITLQIDGIHNDAENCQKVEDVLLTTRGIISFTFDLQRSRVNIRARADLSTEKIVLAIANVEGLLVQTVTIRKSSGEEVLSEPYSNKENERRSSGDKTSKKSTATESLRPAQPVIDEPDYLDEMSDSDDAALHSQSSKSKHRTALSTPGGHNKNRSRKTGTGGSGWFSNLGDYISKSIYW